VIKSFLVQITGDLAKSLTVHNFFGLLENLEELVLEICVEEFNSTDPDSFILHSRYTDYYRRVMLHSHLYRHPNYYRRVLLHLQRYR